MPARVKRPLEGAYDLALGNLLARTGRRQREDELQRLDECWLGWVQRNGSASHHRPFHSRGLLDIFPHQAAQFVLRLAREACGQNEDGSKRGGLAADGGAGVVIVAPHLRGRKNDEQTKDDAERR